MSLFCNWLKCGLLVDDLEWNLDSETGNEFGLDYHLLMMTGLVSLEDLLVPCGIRIGCAFCIICTQ